MYIATDLDLETYIFPKLFNKRLETPKFIKKQFLSVDLKKKKKNNT